MFKTQVLTELIHGTLPIGDKYRACWSALSTKRISWIFGCSLQNVSKVVV